MISNQNQITEITDSTAENLVLYAKFLDESTISQYTVEYYKQKEDESGYDLVTEDTERIEAIIGTEVSAEEKEYDGYILSENSVTKGIVIAEGKLVLRLYYDIKKKTLNQEYKEEHMLMKMEVKFHCKRRCQQCNCIL